MGTPGPRADNISCQVGQDFLGKCVRPADFPSDTSIQCLLSCTTSGFGHSYCMNGKKSLNFPKTHHVVTNTARYIKPYIRIKLTGTIHVALPHIMIHAS